MPDLAQAMQLISGPLHVMDWQLHVTQGLPSLPACYQGAAALALLCYTSANSCESGMHDNVPLQQLRLCGLSSDIILEQLKPRMCLPAGQDSANSGACTSPSLLPAAGYVRKQGVLCNLSAPQ